jgi:hypothetical protein
MKSHTLHDFITSELKKATDRGKNVTLEVKPIKLRNRHTPCTDQADC